MNLMKDMQLTVMVKGALAFLIAISAPSFAKDAQQNAIVAKGTNVVCEVSPLTRIYVLHLMGF